jgi:exopolysaccharide biosynthesis polyprenyl glycosylphosphotransferase
MKTFRRFEPNYVLLLYLLDLGCGIVALWSAQRLRLLLPIATLVLEAEARVPFTVYLLVFLILAIVLPLESLYDARRTFGPAAEASRVVSGVVISSLLLAGVLYVSYRELSRYVFLYFVVVDVLLLLSTRSLLRMLSMMFRWDVQAPVRVLIAGSGRLGRQAARALRAAAVPIAGFVDDDPAKHATQADGLTVLSGLDGIATVIEQELVTDVVVALPNHAQERLAALAVSLWKLPIRIHMIPDMFDLGFARAQVDYLGGLTVIGMREPVVDGFQRVGKRLLDLALGAAILLAALPVMAVIAVAIRMDSPGPVLFKQRRVGENGRCFAMYKFRSMAADAAQRQGSVNRYTDDGKVIHKRPDDPRVTRVGRVLRRFSLDELPQLINVLRGEMSLVGPRPELPWIVEQYDPWQYQRLAVPQGMTSWYVVNGRSHVPMHLNTDQDLRYVRNYSFLQDLQILWRSVAAVARGRGAF